MNIHRAVWLISGLLFAACGGGDHPRGGSAGAVAVAPSGEQQTAQAATAPAAAPASSAGASAATPQRTASPAATSGAPAAAPAGAAAITSAGAGGMSAATAGTPAAGSGMPSAGADSMMSVSSSEPMPSPGCSGGSLRMGRSNGTIQSSGGNRTYIQYVPSGYDGSKPVPLLVDLHPFSVGASFAESSSGFRQLADTEGYVYLAPQGLSNMWDSTGDTDEKFIRDLVTSIAADGCIDLRRVYATGCSNGGAFSFLLMCTAEDVFAAVAPMCGTAFVNLETMCMMDRPF
jgi:polyhydroxybutyrate depolymerase